MVLAAPVDGPFPAILYFITIENNVIHNLTMKQSVIVNCIEVIQTFAPIVPPFIRILEHFWL